MDFIIEKLNLKKMNRLLEVYIISSNLFSVDKIKEIKRQFSKKLDDEFNICLMIKYTNLEIDERFLEDYIVNFKYNLSTLFALSNLCKEAKDAPINICISDNGYEIKTSSSVIFNHISGGKIIDKLRKVTEYELGQKIDIDFVKEDTNISLEEHIKKCFPTNIKDLDKEIYEKEKRVKEKKKDETKKIKRSVKFSLDSIPINEIYTEMPKVCITGQILNVEEKKINEKTTLLTFIVFDKDGAIYCKKFIRENSDEDMEVYKNNNFVKIEGETKIDTFIKKLCIMVNKIQIVPKVIRKDLYEEKRVELHVHTIMSDNDGLISPKDLLNQVKNFGYSKVAITDHSVVQAYPDVMNSFEKSGVKPIYGCEFNMIDDEKKYVEIANETSFDDTFVVFDLETTGFSNKRDKITEFGACKIKNRKIIDTFSMLVNPEIPIPANITRITGIDDEMVKGKPTIEEALPEFIKFVDGAILVAHNADFDTGFIRTKSEELNIDYDFEYMDTVTLARLLYPNFKNHKLDTIAKELNVSLENHHRAVDDAKATADIFLKFIEKMKDLDLENFNDVNTKLSMKNTDKIWPTSVTVLVKNQDGLKDLYKLVSLAHTKYLQKFPVLPIIPKSELEKRRKNLLFGSSDSEGDVFKSVLKNNPISKIEEYMNFYDYIEIMPAHNHNHLLRYDLKSHDDIRDIYKKIIKLAKKLNKIVVAVSDCHYLEKEDKIYRKILKTSMKRTTEYPEDDLYLRNTEELFEEFSYLDEEDRKKFIIDNTLLIADMIEDVKPVPDGTFPPIIEGSEKTLRDICYKNAIDKYSENLPKIVEDRLERELTSIISNGYAVLYIIAQKLVKKSNEDGYLVGSRGSVGSSFVATMSNITEVNPLPPHYRCPECKYSEFTDNPKYATGIDLPDKDCPKCKTKMIKDGFDIPFEVFLGFEGDKEPDIDLNFAGEYQSEAHKFVMELFGEDKVYRAGTIGTIAEKTAYGYVKKYSELTGENIQDARVEALSTGIAGIKRTTGQHPGGIMIVPKNKEIYDFSPIQYPANDKKTEVLTTHFDYHSISGRILKLDILGHDGPTIIKKLEKFTKLKNEDIPLDDENTMSLFNSTDALKCDLTEIDCNVGTLGIPEFGTNFVRNMLVDTRPNTFGELVRISGLSHGANVWTNNAQNLVKDKVATLKEIISTRDDIMNYLISKNLIPKHAFTIMERVRKGKGLTDENIEEMKENNVPNWYIDSCQKIEYMFPKAHAAAYVMLSFRIAYYKINYPEAFYATYFTTKVQDFDISIVKKGEVAVLDKLNEFKMNINDLTDKEKNMFTVLEVAYEMHKRGIKITDVDLYKSKPKEFELTDDGVLLPPLMAINGLGDVAAKNIYEEAKKGTFMSIEDFKNRTKANKNVIEVLEQNGAFSGLSETNQLTFNI